jgi:hypothetical protein
MKFTPFPFSITDFANIEPEIKQVIPVMPNGEFYTGMMCASVL